MLDWIYHGLQGRKSIPELLAAGESDTVEFKSSARWNLHAGKETPEIKDAITKTVAAFLNTDGGTLLIGVNDDAEVVGLENDTKLVKGKDLDGFENWLMGAHLRSALGKPAAAHVKVSWGHLDGGDVCRLDVHPSPAPVYAKTSAAPKVFYVRLGNSPTNTTSKRPSSTSRATGLRIHDLKVLCGPIADPISEGVTQAGPA